MSNLKIQENINLAPLTTFKIGGRAKFFVEVSEEEELMGAIEWAEDNKQEFFILAGGSNVLIQDKGIDGLVIKINNQDLVIEDNKIKCGAGVNLGVLVNKATENNLTGLEWAIGIPGTVGGAVRGNAGAFGESISGNIEIVEFFDLDKKTFSIIKNKDCGFKYRYSVFKENEDKLIWNTIIELKKGKEDDINNLVSKNIEYRKNQPKLPSAGSIFKNIEIEKLKEYNNNLANKAIDDKKVKGGMVGSGWVIDQLGIKGKVIGGAMISQEHANFIVNNDKATTEDVVMLISYIKQQARDELKVQLQEEIQYLGF